MSSLSLLILAVVAGFLFYQLRSVLGQTPYDAKKRNSDRQKTPPLLDHPPKQKNPLAEDIEMSDIISPVITADNQFLKGSVEEKTQMAEKLNHIKESYPEFDVANFAKGVESAYIMIIEAFTENKLKEIEDFVSPEIYQTFSKLREDYTNKKYDYSNVITNIESVRLVTVRAEERTAYITTEIKSLNVTALKDEHGNILHGDPQTVKTVTDIWEFSRDYNASSPAWTLISMSK